MSNTNGTNVPLDENWSGKSRQLLPISRQSADTVERAATTMADNASTLMRYASELFAVAASLRKAERDGMLADSADDFRDALARWQEGKDNLERIGA